jgi:hypothetical protein
LNEFLENDRLRRRRHEQAGEVTLVGLIPTALARVTKTQPQQKTFEPVSGFALIVHRRITRPD